MSCVNGGSMWIIQLKTCTGWIDLDVDNLGRPIQLNKEEADKKIKFERGIFPDSVFRLRKK